MKYQEWINKHGEDMPKMRKPMSHQEDSIQKDCVEWFKKTGYPQLAPLLFHPNNEAFYGGSKLKRSITGARMRDMGVTAGVADIILLHPGKDGQHGLCIEFKAGRNGQEPEQKEWQKIVTEHGYEYIICRSADDFKAITEQYLGISPKNQDDAAIARLFGPGFKAKIHKTNTK